MSIRLSVKGFRPPDDTYKQMRAVYDACVKAKVPIPRDVERFFDGDCPDDAGVTVDIKEATSKWNSEYAEGYEIDLKKLPPHVTVIRCYLS